MQEFPCVSEEDLMKSMKELEVRSSLVVLAATDTPLIADRKVEVSFSSMLSWKTRGLSLKAQTLLITRLSWPLVRLSSKPKQLLW